MPSKKSSRPEQLGLHFDVTGLLCGVDEAGRGPLAGPVVAAAVILDPRQPIDGLDDSKKLNERARERLFEEIRARALCFGIAEATVDEIDRINILQATLLAMKRAVEGMRLKPAKVLVDGNRLPTLRIPAEAIVQGDALVPSISAASILAKVHRDRLLHALHAAHPEYGFDGHKGYSTPEHLAALKRHGACVHHRRSFAPVREALTLDRLLAPVCGPAAGASVPAPTTGVPTLADLAPGAPAALVAPGPIALAPTVRAVRAPRARAG